MESVTELQELMETCLDASVFNRIQQPVFTGYYFKDENNQDKVVRVDAMLRMHDQLATAVHLQRAIAFPEAGAHVIGSPISSSAWEQVRDSIIAFGSVVMGLQKHD